MIRGIVVSHRAINPRIFGLDFNGIDTEASVLNLLIDLGAIQNELEELLGISANALTPKKIANELSGKYFTGGNAAMTDSKELEWIRTDYESILVEPLTKTASIQASELLRKAVTRMYAAPIFFSPEEWNALASYESSIISGNEHGKVPDDLEKDDNE